MNYNDLLVKAVNAAIKAGDAISEVYRSTFTFEFKEDRSPLTLADTKSHEIISGSLSETDIPILSEEGKSIDYETRQKWERFWLVDPLDGTKEFIKKNGEFTVNIALIEGRSPVMGVIYVPEKSLLYFTTKYDGSRRMTDINSELTSTYTLDDFINGSERLPCEDKGDAYKVVGSRSHMSEETLDFIESLKRDHKNIEIVSIGSSLKLCLVAEGSARIYPRFGPTMEWDTAAGHAIALIAGRKVTHRDMKTPLEYNKENLLNPWFVVF